MPLTYQTARTPAAASRSRRRQDPVLGPYSAQDRACRSSTPGFSGLPIGPMPGAESSVQPSRMTLTATAKGRASGQPAGSEFPLIPSSLRPSATRRIWDAERRRAPLFRGVVLHEARALADPQHRRLGIETRIGHERRGDFGGGQRRLQPLRLFRRRISVTDNNRDALHRLQRPRPRPPPLVALGL